MNLKIFTGLISVAVLPALFCTSCNLSKEYNPFDAEIKYAMPIAIAELEESAVYSIPGGFIPNFVCDSLIISPYGFDALLSVWDFKNNRNVGDFIPSGDGEGRMQSLYPFFRHTAKGDGLCFYLQDYLAGRINRFSLRTAAEGKEPYLKLHSRLPEYAYEPLVLHDGSVLYQAESEGEAMLLHTDREGKLLDSWILYPGEEPRLASGILNYHIAVNEDETKVAMAMIFLPQINILDMTTGKRQSVVLSDADCDRKSVVEAYKKSGNIAEPYFYNVWTSDDRIFATGHHYAVSEEDSSYGLFYIFDWNGNLLYRFKMDGEFATTMLDMENGMLYASDYDGHLYAYDLNKYI